MDWTTPNIFSNHLFCNSVILPSGAPGPGSLSEPPPNPGLEPAVPDVTRGAQADPAPAPQPARAGVEPEEVWPRRRSVARAAAILCGRRRQQQQQRGGAAAAPPARLLPCFPPSRPRRPAAAAPCLPRAPSPPRPRSRRWVAGPRSAGSPAGLLPPPSARPGLSLPQPREPRGPQRLPGPAAPQSTACPGLSERSSAGRRPPGRTSPAAVRGWRRRRRTTMMARSGCSGPSAVCAGRAGPMALPRPFSGLGPAPSGCSAGRAVLRDGLRLTIAAAGWTAAIIRRLNVCFTCRKCSAFNAVNSGAEIPKSQRQ